MDSWTATAHTPSPAIKFENSPTESLLSTPGEMYPSLFGAESSPTPSTIPIDMMTPQSHTDDIDDMKMLVALTEAQTQTQADRSSSVASATPEPEKKPTKKRKSWGQVLPEPKTNLPPRKRAKTEDEKEQRRVERVLRNRRAAQSSRERKRLEVEALEKRNKDLETALLKAHQVIKQLTSGGAGLNHASLTFSPELFSSHDSQNNTTIDPSAISPTLAPIPEAENENVNGDANLIADSTPAPVNASPDSAQHPAEMLSSDLPCQLAEASPSPWMEHSQLPLPPSLPLLLQLQFLLASTSAMISLCQRPLMQIAMSLKAGFSLPPTRSLLNTIVWLVTTPAASRSTRRTGLNSTSTISSTTATSMSQLTTISSRCTNPTVARSQTRLTSSLRLRLLRKILTCSPSLARPLMDATLEALRLASSSKSHTVDRVEAETVAAAAADGKTQQQQQKRGGPANWLPGVALPSKEVLLTLLWTLKVEERRLEIRQQAMSSQEQQSGSVCVSRTSTPTITIIKKQSQHNNSKRALPEAEERRQDLQNWKRQRF
ncbi:hypothetical protein QBC38DRAFT_484349 [Podospora fimiseda]|uniref:BZIP domain-containing protein n=1 Tax=Podospora fimiseda TaxID=252190 RepID=A0AAN7BKF1_9PEZI|nr:hypothetical protein QBC38DRAFT_484349 [Podospora fimiseda]